MPLPRYRVNEASGSFSPAISAGQIFPYLRSRSLPIVFQGPLGAADFCPGLHAAALSWIIIFPFSFCASRADPEKRVLGLCPRLASLRKPAWAKGAHALCLGLPAVRERFGVSRLRSWWLGNLRDSRLPSPVNMLAVILAVSVPGGAGEAAHSGKTLGGFKRCRASARATSPWREEMTRSGYLHFHF